jgi:hypothetical protein
LFQDGWAVGLGWGVSLEFSLGFRVWRVGGGSSPLGFVFASEVIQVGGMSFNLFLVPVPSHLGVSSLSFLLRAQFNLISFIFEWVIPLVISFLAAHIHLISFFVDPFYLWLIEFIGPCPTGRGTIALDPTFGSFMLLEPVSYQMNQFFWRKCLDCLDWNGFFWCSECGNSR